MHNFVRRGVVHTINSEYTGDTYRRKKNSATCPNLEVWLSYISFFIFMLSKVRSIPIRTWYFLGACNNNFYKFWHNILFIETQLQFQKPFILTSCVTMLLQVQHQIKLQICVTDILPLGCHIWIKGSTQLVHHPFSNFPHIEFVLFEISTVTRILIVWNQLCIP